MNNQTGSLKVTYNYLDIFFKKLQNEGAAHKSPADFKQHFSRWLALYMEKNKQQTQTTASYARF